jgi:hypothetical protein
MSQTVYVQSKSFSSGTPLGINSFTFTLNNPVVSSNWVYLSFRVLLSSIAASSLNVTTSVGSVFPAIQYGPNPAGTANFFGVWSALLTGSGLCTFTVTITSTATIRDYNVVAVEYTTDDVSTAQGFVSFQGWSGPNLGGSPFVGASDAAGINPLIASVTNEKWKSSTVYNNAGTSQIEDTTATPQLWGVFIAGTSGLTPPTWSGALVNDLAPLVWQQIGTNATAGLMNILTVAVRDAFVEFPAFAESSGWILREQSNGPISGIQLWEKNTTFVDAETITLTKSVNTYRVDLSLVPMSSSAPGSGLPPPPILISNIPVIYLPVCHSAKCRTISMVFERE